MMMQSEGILVVGKGINLYVFWTAGWWQQHFKHLYLQTQLFYIYKLILTFSVYQVLCGSEMDSWILI